MTVDLSMKKCRIRVFRSLAIAAAGVVLAGCAGAPSPTASSSESSSDHFPVDIASCGHTSTVNALPERAVTLNQGATEVMLALGLEDQMAGTAYLDDEIAEKWRSAYESVPVLADEYPSHEKLLATSPDFIYASYSSAFERKVAGTQGDLDSMKVSSYLSPFGCADEGRRPAPSFEAIWDEVDSIAAAFDVSDRAAELKEEQQKTLGSVSEAGKGLDVLWYDSGTKTPTVGAGDGAPQLVLDSIGATNIFAEKNGGWADG
ncbi:MAG TPA: ABC transporter substrate-binding protein, partial [Nocardioidaceae bacterium]|nr:ABC transporter substrate-binding protein [Nocardioidaceae bacterium]